MNERGYCYRAGRPGILFPAFEMCSGKLCCSSHCLCCWGHAASVEGLTTVNRGPCAAGDFDPQRTFGKFHAGRVGAFTIGVGFFPEMPQEVETAEWGLCVLASSTDL